MLATAMCEGKTSNDQRIGSMPMEWKKPAIGPLYWLKIWVKITATATGATMYGSSTDIRQNVLALSA